MVRFCNIECTGAKFPNDCSGFKLGGVMEYLVEYRDFISNVILKFLNTGLWIYIPTQAIVYLSGRMFGILNSYRARNSLAFISILVFSYWYVVRTIPTESIMDLLWFCIQYASMSVIWYVIVGFKLFIRLDNLQDKKIASDNEKKGVKKK